MDRFDNIPEIALGWHREGKGAVLATVVETWGSAPRRVGSQLAISSEGEIEGSVSGGCVEGAVVVEALEDPHAGSIFSDAALGQQSLKRSSGICVPCRLRTGQCPSVAPQEWHLGTDLSRKIVAVRHFFIPCVTFMEPNAGERVWFHENEQILYFWSRSIFPDVA